MTGTTLPGPTPVEFPAEEPAPATTAITGSVARGASWATAGRLSSQLLQFLTGLALARLLLPADFGLLASVYVVTGLAGLLFSSGLSGALVYERDLREEDLSSAFWLNALGGVGFIAVLAALGPAVAAFFGDPRLIYLTPLAGLPFAFFLGLAHSALLTRSMRFKQLAFAELLTAVTSNSVTLVAAVAGLGPLALVTGPAVGSIVMTIVLWSTCRWHPTSFITPAAVRKLWRFSGGMLGFGLVDYVGRNTDNLLIGRFVGATALGLYNRAYNLMLLPLHQVGGGVGQVVFPALASMGDDRARVSTAYRRTVKLTTMLTAPLLVGMAATAPALVPVLWGDGWGRAVILIQVLCLAGLPQLFSSTEGWLYQSQGRTRLMLVMGLLSAAVGVLGIVIGVQWGVTGVAIGVLISAYVLLPINLHVACSVIGLRTWRVYADNAVTLCLATGMGAAVWSVPLITGWARSSGGVLAVQVLLGALLYSVGLAVLRRDLVNEAAAAVRAARRRA